MAFSESDLVKLDAAIVGGVKSVTFADGRRTEFHSLDEMRRLRGDMKAELSAAASQVNRRNRFSVARMRRL